MDGTIDWNGEMQRLAMQCNALQSYIPALFLYTSSSFKVSVFISITSFFKYRLFVTDPIFDCLHFVISANICIGTKNNNKNT